MGLFDKILGGEMHVVGADGVRILDVPTCMNLRELGGYDTPDGPTCSHRFLRAGSTRCLNARDKDFLRDYGLTHVLDLRSFGESPQLTCSFARMEGITWSNVELFGRNLSDASLVNAHQSLEYLSRGYLSMLCNHGAVRDVMTFLARVPHRQCALFHCAAGMDRTGVTSMLLLGMAGVSRDDIIRDYLYSFAPVAEADRYVAEGEGPEIVVGSRLQGRMNTIAGVYDAITEAYGGVEPYLEACGVEKDDRALLRTRLLVE